MKHREHGDKVYRQKGQHYPMPHTGAKEQLAHRGVRQGDMAPCVEDYQKPDRDYSQTGFSRTDAYIERQDGFQGREAADIKRQGYIGRYS